MVEVENVIVVLFSFTPFFQKVLKSLSLYVGAESYLSLCRESVWVTEGVDGDLQSTVSRYFVPVLLVNLYANLAVLRPSGRFCNLRNMY